MILRYNWALILHILLYLLRTIMLIMYAESRELVMLTDIQKQILGLLCVAVLGFGVFRRFRRSRPVQSNNSQLIVGTNVGYPPFVFRDEAGSIVGFDIDLMQAIGKKLGKEIILKDLTFDALLIALQQKKVDLIIGGISVTPERARKVPFVPYHGDNGVEGALVTWEKDLHRVASLSDIASFGDVTICTQAGTVFEGYLEQYPNIRIKTLADIGELVLDLRYGKSFACLLDKDASQTLASRNSSLRVQPVALGNRSEGEQGAGIGIHPDNRSLYRDITRAVDELTAAGVIPRLHTIWFGNSGI